MVNFGSESWRRTPKHKRARSAVYMGRRRPGKERLPEEDQRHRDYSVGGVEGSSPARWPCTGTGSSARVTSTTPRFAEPSPPPTDPPAGRTPARSWGRGLQTSTGLIRQLGMSVEGSDDLARRLTAHLDAEGRAVVLEQQLKRAPMARRWAANATATSSGVYSSSSSPKSPADALEGSAVA